MNLRNELLKELSKQQSTKIARWIGDDAERFAGLVKLFLANEYRVSQRAAAVLSECYDNHPELIKPHLNVLVVNLQKPGLHDAVRRNTVRVFQFMEIPEELMGILADVCMGFIANADETIAVKAFSMTVALNITRHYPELKNELKLLIEEQLPNASAGLHNRAMKVLKELERIK